MNDRICPLYIATFGTSVGNGDGNFISGPLTNLFPFLLFFFVLLFFSVVNVLNGTADVNNNLLNNS